MQKTTLILVSLFLLTSNIAFADECPELNTDNIGSAACSSKEMPFQTNALAKVKFVAQTPCPVALGIKKKLQTIFKGKKPYPATGTHVKSKGMATCTYTLDEKWKKALGVKDDKLILRTEFKDRGHFNYWAAPRMASNCPNLDSSLINDLSGDHTLHIGAGDSSSQYDFEFKADKMQKAFSLSGLLSSNKDLPTLRGQGEITQDYQVECEYTYHSGKEETKIKLVGQPIK